MRTVKITLSVVALLLLTFTTRADRLKIGAPVPSFSSLECTDGKTCSLDDLKDKDVLVICITCNHCPVAEGYEDRIIDFNKKYCGEGSKVGFIAINVNNSPQDRMDKMKERAKEKGFNFTYAYDPSQKIAVNLGALRTPEFFVFNKERKLVYQGAFDNSMHTEKVTEVYLAPAVEATLKGEKIAKPITAAVGCGIIYERR